MMVRSDLNCVSVFAPATVANVGPCFDRAGFAVSAPGDVVSVAWNDSAEIEIVSITGDDGKLPLDPKKNTSGVAAREILMLAKEKRGVRIWLEKKMPLFSGLGSSAASGAAAAVAVNELLGHPFTKAELLPACQKAEAVACGAPHADNVAPSLLGGLVTIESADKVESVALDFDFAVVLVTPDFHLSTEISRNALSTVKVELTRDAEEKTARLKNVKSLPELAALISGNEILEAARGPLIPGFFSVKEAGIASGALVVTISGSGPSLFALVEKVHAEAVARAMQNAFLISAKLPSQTWITALDREGARRI